MFLVLVLSHRSLRRLSHNLPTSQHLRVAGGSFTATGAYCIPALAITAQRVCGLASERILLANSSRWDGSHHELGECGLPGSCERRAREPGTKPDEVHGSRCQHVLKMRLGETDVAGAPQV